MPSRKLALMIIGMLVGLSPTSTEAQDQVRARAQVQVRTQNLGWTGQAIRSRAQLGIEGKLTFRQDGRATNTIVFVQGTRAGTPAQLAGLVRGDSIVGIDGRRLTLDRWTDFRASLEPGQEVRLTLLRDGKQREVLLEAAPADPMFGADGNAWNVEIPEDIQVRVELIQDRLLQAFQVAQARYAAQPKIAVTLLQSDSTIQATLDLMQEARHGFSYSFETGTDAGKSSWVIVTPGADRIDREADPRSVTELLREAPPAPEAEWNAFFEGPTGLSFEVTQVAPLPVEFLVMSGEVADSLTGAYVVVRSELAQVRQQQFERELEIVAEERVRGARLRRSDGVLSSLDGENRRLYSRLQSLEAQFREFHELEVGAAPEPYGSRTIHVVADEPVGGTNRVTVRSTLGRPTEITVAPHVTARVSARLVGQHFVMGAQLRSLNPGLAEYFDAEDGVLVIEVLDGTPAADAGILPGDVIVRAGRHEVREVVDVRRALVEGRSGLRFRVIRKGDTLTVRIGR